MKLISRIIKLASKPIDCLKPQNILGLEGGDLFTSLGSLTIVDNSLIIEGYPFEPSIAFKQAKINATQIIDIDIECNPPSFRIDNEIVFLSSENSAELEEFAHRNGIKLIKRPFIWEFILEPFLDTEFTTETNERLNGYLEKYGLSRDLVKSLRAEVETQMLKYNFDTMLWEWGVLGLSDVLRAMRTKYNKAEFLDFYNRAMKIALLAKKMTNIQASIFDNSHEKIILPLSRQ